MTTIAELAVKVTTTGAREATDQLGKLGKAAKDADSQVSASGTKMTRTFQDVVRDLQQLKRPLQVVGVGLGAALAGGAVLAVRKWSEAFQELSQTLRSSRELGLSAEQFSRLEFAAKASDMAVADLTGGMRNLTRFMAEAAKGGKEQAGLLDQLGISATNADGSLRPMHAVLRDIAEQFPKIEGPTNRSAVAMKFFGEQGGKLVPILEDGAEGLDRMARKSDELGYTFTGPMQTGAQEITRKLAEMKLTMDGLWRQSLAELLPMMQDLASLMNSPQFRSGFQAIVSGATASAQALAGLIGKVGQVSEALKAQDKRSTQFLQDQVNGFQRQIDEIRTDETGAFRIRATLGFDNQKLIDELEAQKAPIQAEIDRRMQFTMPPVEAVIAGSNAPVAIDWGALGGGDGGGGKGRKPRADNSMREALEDAQRLMEAQGDWRDQLLDLQADLSGPMAQVMRQYQRQMGELDAAYAKGEVTLADYAQMQELLTQARDRDAQAVQSQLTPVQQLISDLGFENKMLVANREEQIRLTAARWAGANATAEQVEEVRQLLATNEQLTTVQRNWQEFSGNLADSMADAIKGTRSLKDALLDFADSLSNQILRNITQDWANSITDLFKGMAGGMSGGNTGGGGFNWTSLVEGLFGGGMKDGGVTGHARMVPAVGPMQVLA